MSNTPKAKGRPGIRRRIAAHFAKYSGSLPKEFGRNQDALTAKVVCEGSVHVALNLFTEAVEDENYELAEAIRASLVDARQHLNSLNLVDLSINAIYEDLQHDHG